MSLRFFSYRFKIYFGFVIDLFKKNKNFLTPIFIGGYIFLVVKFYKKSCFLINNFKLVFNLAGVFKKYDY